MNLFGPARKIVKIVRREQQVIIGESFERLISNQPNLNRSEKKRLEDSTVEIIKNCVNPVYSSSQRNNNTGLVIGKIQSGKTLSFTCAIALARDNGYKVVIVISGRTNLLLKQTMDRLKADLTNRDRYMSIIVNAETEVKKRDSIRQLRKALMRRESQGTKTVIVPILKHQGRLAGLRQVFQNMDIRNLLETNSVLIIDDEADQASLNTRARNNARFGLQDESAIFATIKNLRHALPNHTYIQYTATPQAPLLIDTATILSPDWHVLLSPGDSYTGGQEFFEENRTIVDIIPQEGDYPPDINNLQTAPQSLNSTIIEFLILASLMGGDIAGKESYCYNDRATMLVHPTWRVVGKDENVAIDTFFDWIQNIVDGLERDLDQEDYSSFEPHFEIVQSRLKDKGLFDTFPQFEDTMEALRDWVLGDLKVHQVTGGKLGPGEEFPWDNHRYHILVGGQLLDRGFTVENLIMTYMPRDAAGNNQADTIEQRCRFYGYRKKYLDFCRVYITPGLKVDYLSYNEHERELYKYLQNHTLAQFMEDGSRMMMDRNLIPTNMSRISNTIISTHLKGFQFFNPQVPFLEENNMITESFIRKIKDYEGSLLEPRIEDHRKVNVQHWVTKVPIHEIIDYLLDIEFNNMFEIMKRATMLRYIDHLKDEIKQAWVIEIAHNRAHPRERTVKFIQNPKNGKNQYEIAALAAGDTKFGDGDVYFGDTSLLIETDRKRQSSKIFEYDGELIMQIHKVKAAQDTSRDMSIRDKEFYTLAFNFSDRLRTRYISTLSNDERHN